MKLMKLALFHLVGTSMVQVVRQRQRYGWVEMSKMGGKKGNARMEEEWDSGGDGERLRRRGWGAAESSIGCKLQLP